MSTADDLRTRADRLRRAIPPQRRAEPPKENGERLATIDRSHEEQIRINWCTYEGKPYVSIRLWTRSRDGSWWPDGKRGLSIRIREIADLAEAVAECIDRAERALESRRDARPTPGRAIAPADCLAFQTPRSVPTTVDHWAC